MDNATPSKVINPATIEALRFKDQIFDDIYKLYGSPPSWSRPEGFETLCKIILEQQVSLQSAHATFIKLKSHLGTINPASVLKTPKEVMRDLSVSRQKDRYLKALSAEIENEDLDLITLGRQDDEVIARRLLAITGIGRWTVDVYLIFALQRPDIFPPGDVALINTVKELKSVESKEEIDEVVTSWSPYRTAAAFFLWHYYLSKRGRSNDFV